MKRRLKRTALGSLVALALIVGGFALEGLIDDGAVAQTAVVLGNQVHPDGTPSARLRARLDHAIALYEAKRVKQILVSGATGVEGVNEGVVMGAYIRARSDAPVLVDDAGRTTRATAQNAARMIGGQSVIAVSQYFHVARCRLALSQAGFDEVSGSAPLYFEWRDLYSVPRDIAAVVVYALRG